MNLINLEELEKLTEKLYGANQDSSLLEYFNTLKEKYVSELKFQELFEMFIVSKCKNFQFWVFDLQIYMINSSYNNFSNEQKLKYKEILVYLLDKNIEKIFTANFIETKFCVLFINWIKHDYPENWPNLFKDLITIIFNTNEENLKIMKINFLIDLLLTFDDELIKFRHTYSDFEVNRSTIIKDYMRQDGVSEIIYIFNQLLQNEKFINKKTIKNCIRSISQLVDWNSLNLFEESISIVTTMIGQIDYQAVCLEVFNSIIAKGMEPTQKLEVIKYLNINQIIEKILTNIQNLNEDSAYQICEIVSNIGNFTIDSFEMLKSIVKGEQIFQNENNLLSQTDMFNQIFELANYSLYHSIKILNYSVKSDAKISIQLCDYLSNFISYLKSNDFIAEKLIQLLQSFIYTIENLLVIPDEYDIKTSLIINPEDDDFFNFRKEYSILYHNMFQINCLKLIILNSINEKLQNLFLLYSNSNTSEANPDKHHIYNIELALNLINFLQNGININDLQIESVSEAFNKVIYYLFNIPFCDVGSDYILIYYYETIYKYLQYIINNDSILLYIARLYLSNKGIMHSNHIVGAKITVFFDKFVDKVKTQLGKMEIIYDISTTLKNFINYLSFENKNFNLVIEYNILYRTFGQIILQKNFNEEKRQILFKEIFSTFDLIFNNFGLDVDKFNEVSKCITNFIKCIGYELNPNSKIIFIDYFNNFIKEVYLKIPKNFKTDYSMITILQRLVNILGKDSLQYLEYFIDNQVKYPDVEIFEDSCKILQNATQILKKESKSLIQNYFFYFYTKLITFKIPEFNISEIDKNILSLYSCFAKLIANITIDIVEVLFESGGLKHVNVEELIKFLIYISYNVIDANIRRTVIKSIKAIVIYILKILTLGVEDSQSLYNYLQIILNSIFKVYSKLNIADPIDFNTLPEIVQIHHYVLKGLPNFYVNLMSNVLDGENSQIYLDHLNNYDVKKFKVGDVLLNYFNVISNF